MYAETLARSMYGEYVLTSNDKNNNTQYGIYSAIIYGAKPCESSFWVL